MDQKDISNQNNLDTIMGTTTRIPRLLNADGYYEWKYRMENYLKMKDNRLWRSISKGPTLLTIVDSATGDPKPKPIALYTEDDFNKTDADNTALATLTMALSPDIAQGFRQYKTAQDLWNALEDVYEGNDDMKESRQDSLRQQFNMFNHIVGETLEAQLQRFITLHTQLKTFGVLVSETEINKKLLNSLPRN